MQMQSPQNDLRGLANRAARTLSEIPNPAARKRAADFALSFWLEDARDGCCGRFKHDIEEWLSANKQLEDTVKLARLLAIAQIHLRGPEREPDLEATLGLLDFHDGDVVTITRDGTERHFLCTRDGQVETDLGRQLAQRRKSHPAGLARKKTMA